jgi:nucleoid-associated protein YgaU
MTLKSFLKKVKAAESAVSMVLGIAVVVVVGVILFNYFRSYSTGSRGSQKESSTEEGKINGGSSISLPARYTVARGDTLWKIAEKFYGSGYNWVDLSRENKISQPNQIEAGQELVIPKVAVKQATAKTVSVSQAKATSQGISSTQYTVIQGDTLWDISVRAYQDGYKWPQIAEANHLVNPGLIHPGNVLTIPR